MPRHMPWHATVYVTSCHGICRGMAWHMPCLRKAWAMADLVPFRMQWHAMAYAMACHGMCHVLPWQLPRHGISHVLPWQMPWHAMAYAMACDAMCHGMPCHMPWHAMAYAVACHGTCHGIEPPMACAMASRLVSRVDTAGPQRQGQWAVPQGHIQSSFNSWVLSLHFSSQPIFVQGALFSRIGPFTEP